MNDEDRSRCFQKMGFWEANKAKVNLSCGQCRESVLASTCIEKNSKIENSRFFKEKLELFCPKCDSLVIGACI